MFGCIVSKIRVMLKNCRASDSLDVINRCREADRARNIWRAGLESMRRFLKRAFFQSYTHYHFAAAMPWRHRIEDLGLPIERADAGRATHFVSGKSEEIAAQLLDVNR